jgi:putative hemolysin
VSELSTEPLSSAGAYPVHPEAIPEFVLEEHGFRLSFARTVAELEAIQRLRFEVFNLELGEGLEASHRTGLDSDHFDAVCHHLIIRESRTGAVAGTYRMQVNEMARSYGGFYTADEFQLEMLPEEVVGNSIEVGRACVARQFRNRHVLFMLWKGLTAYLRHNRKRFVFGCCSLTSQDPSEGKRVMEFLENSGHTHSEFRLDPQPDWECYPPGFESDSRRSGKVKLPKLFSLYMRYGARVCGPPALDRHFKTIDYMVLFDWQQIGKRRFGMLTSRGR